MNNFLAAENIEIIAYFYIYDLHSRRFKHKRIYRHENHMHWMLTMLLVFV